MSLTPEQIKGRIKNVAKQNNADARVLMRYRDDINLETFRNAFEATCKKRNSLKLIATGGEIIEKLAVDKGLMDLWASYQRKYSYAEEIAYENAITSVRKIYKLLIE